MDIPGDDRLAQFTNELELIFVGKMSYEPNVLAVTHFATMIFPRLREKFPQLSFTVVGSNPGKRVLGLAEIEGISVTGFVESLEPYFRQCAIVVAPMLSGAGIQNKIIQAMSYGCCVATSTIGAEGLTINNKEIAIYNSDEEWIEGLERLLKDKELRREMGLRARDYVKINLSEEVISKQFSEFINSANKQ